MKLHLLTFLTHRRILPTVSAMKAIIAIPFLLALSFLPNHAYAAALRGAQQPDVVLADQQEPSSTTNDERELKRSHHGRHKQVNTPYAY